MQYTEPTIFSALEEGTFSFSLGISPWLFGLLVFAIYFLVWATYLKTTRTISVPWKIFFVATRGSVLVLILFCLLRPVVTTIQTSPQETYLGILIDDSQSMSIGDLDGGQTRASGVENALFNDGLIENLSESFQIRTFRFDGETQRIAGVDDLIEDGMAIPSSIKSSTPAIRCVSPSNRKVLIWKDSDKFSIKPSLKRAFSTPLALVCPPSKSPMDIL